MTDRREFLTALSAVTVSALRPSLHTTGSVRASVSARATIFHGHPDGRTTLVRFVAEGLDVPAGRLRVRTGSQRDLLGTAGMLRAGDALFGELWLPLERSLSITAELEVPGRRGVMRSWHELNPQRRWTIYWSTVVDPNLLREQLAALDPPQRGIRATLYAAAGVRGNPLASRPAVIGPDHVPFLRMTLPARLLEDEYGIPPSALALASDSMPVRPNTALALAGAGVPLIAPSGHQGDAVWQTGNPGTTPNPIVGSPVIGVPEELGFGKSDGEMTALIERWLIAISAPAAVDAAFVLGGDPSAAFQALAAVRRWNGRFAYPRIVIGHDGERLRHWHGGTAHGVRTADEVVPAAAIADAPSIALLEVMRRDREQMTVERTDGLVALAAGVMGSPAGLDSLARAVASPFSGTMVLNTVPMTRTDIVTLSDGRDEIVTDVPGLGYAFVIAQTVDQDANPTGWRENAVTSPPILEGAGVSMILDSSSGAIKSILDRRTGRSVPLDAEGLNASSGARVETISVATLPGGGTRLSVSRRLNDESRLHTTYTAFESLPWLDIQNRFDPIGTPGPIAYRFGFADPDARISWDVPAGWRRGQPPLGLLTHLRWLGVSAAGWTMLFRGYDAPAISVESSGTLVSHAAPGVSRYRLRFDDATDSWAEAWRFGWETEPFVTAAVAGPSGGSLPTAASWLAIDQSDVALLGVKRADDADGAILYLHELSGTPRTVSLQPGLLRFQSARRVDFVERDLGPIDGMVGEGVWVELAPHEIVTVRLRELSSSGT